MHKHIKEQVYKKNQAPTSLLEKSIMYMLLGELQEDNPPKARYYKLPIGKLRQLFGQDITTQALIEATQGLLLRTFVIEEGKKVMGSSYISSAMNIPEENMLEVGVNSMVHPYLLQLRTKYIDALQL